MAARRSGNSMIKLPIFATRIAGHVVCWMALWSKGCEGYGTANGISQPRNGSGRKKTYFTILTVIVGGAKMI